MPFSEAEKLGITDLLVTQEQNLHILMQLARGVTKSVCDVESIEEALEIVFTHISDAATLLNKRHVTKEILFRYLHSKKVALSGDFNKATLMNKVLKYWHRPAAKIADENHKLTSQTAINDSHSKLLPSTNNSSHEENTDHPNNLTLTLAEQQNYPIHLLARKFAEWFFQNFNNSSLKSQDFWSDSRLILRIAADDRIDDQQCDSADGIISILTSTREHFGFFFNPNLNHAGVQGRMDIHGLVLVLSCGTLHTTEQCVGVFECTFGLLRDPFADNNWKMKTLQCMLRSKGAANVPSLEQSDSLQEALTLPIPTGDVV